MFTDSEYIREIYDQVTQLHGRIIQAQRNVTEAISNMNVWSNVPLFERKEGKLDNLLQLDDRAERVQRRYELIEASSAVLETLLEHNYRLYFNLPEPEVIESSSPEEDAGDTSPDIAEGTDASPKEKDKPKQVAPVEEKKGKGKAKGKGKGKKKKKVPQKTPEEIEQEEREAAERAAKEEQEKMRRDRWTAYENYMDKMVRDNIISGVLISLNFFLDEMGDVKPVTPLFELCVELHEPNIVFIPSVYIDDTDNFYNFLDGLINNILFMAEHMRRIFLQHEEPNYLQDVLNDEHVVQVVQEILCRAQYAMEAAIDYIKKFDDYSYLWLDDRQEVLRQFLLYGRQLTPEELDLLRDEMRSEEIKESRPTIDQFKEQIDFYEELYKKLEKIEMEMVLEGGWMRVDVRRLRQAVLNNVCKWGNLFKQHLYNHVLDSLKELETFIQESIAVMEKPLSEDDYEGLLEVMGYLFKVKERQVATDIMFEPLKQIMDLLKEYGVEFGEEVYVQLQEAPDKWTQCKKVE